MKDIAKRVQSDLPVPAQELALSAWFFVKSRRLHGRAFRAKIGELLQTERSRPDELYDLQSRLLQRAVDAAANAPYFRDLFRRVGVDPARLRRPEDLRALPLLEKDQVRRDPDAFVDGRRDRRSLHVAYTSGTTGTPLRLYFSPKWEALEEAFVARQWRWAGFERQDRRVRLRGDLVVPATERSDRPWRRNLADRELRMSSYHLDAEAVGRYVERIRSFAPRALLAYPSSAALLATLVAQQQLDCEIPLVFTSSETLSHQQRDAISRSLRARVFDHYGTTEAVVAIQQCEMGGYHVLPEYGITEFLPVENDPSGELYEIVATGFTNDAMPLLRYRTGDHARITPQGSCPCGRSFPTVREIVGRVDDLVLSASGALVGRLDHVFKGVPDVVEAQIVQNVDTSVTVRIVPAERFSSVARDALLANLRERLGDLRIMVTEVDSIPRAANGKFRAVVSHVTHKGGL